MAKMQVVNWGPQHDLIVALKAAGMKQKDIAKEMSVSEPWVSVVINSKEGQAKLASYSSVLTEALAQNLAGRISQLSDAAVGNIEKTITANIAPVHRAKVHQDNMSIKVLEHVGVMNPEKQDANHGRPLLSAEGEKRLLDALEKSDKATQAVEAEWEYVDE